MLEGKQTSISSGGMSVVSHKQSQSARQLDQRMSNSGLFYNRFMDDILAIASTR